MGKVGEEPLGPVVDAEILALPVARHVRDVHDILGEAGHPSATTGNGTIITRVLDDPRAVESSEESLKKRPNSLYEHLVRHGQVHHQELEVGERAERVEAGLVSKRIEAAVASRDSLAQPFAWPGRPRRVACRPRSPSPRGRRGRTDRRGSKPGKNICSPSGELMPS